MRERVEIVVNLRLCKNTVRLMTKVEMLNMLFTAKSYRLEAVRGRTG